MTQLVVPAGHRIDVVSASPLPCVMVRKGGAWIAQLGLGSDAQAAELEVVLAELDKLRVALPPRVVFAQGVQLNALFAPANPPVTACEGLLLWVIDAAALLPAVAERLVAQLRAHAIPQVVFVRDASSAAARAVIAAIQALGIETRELEPPSDAALVEVVRPDGFVITALAGKPCENCDPAPFAARAAAVDRAPRLRALVETSDTDRRALYAELATRVIPFVAIAQPTGALRLRTWPDGFTALPVYADRASLLQAVRALEMPAESFAVAEIAPRALFEWASAQRLTVAINVVDDAGQPRYLAIELRDVQTLARGEVPHAP
jgi:hypothetical protein